MPFKKTKRFRPSRIFQVNRSGITLELQSEPEGGYTISVPSLPGCISYGSTFEEAVEMIKDAMSGWLLVAHQEGLTIPEEFESIQLSSI